MDKRKARRDHRMVGWAMLLYLLLQVLLGLPLLFLPLENGMAFSGVMLAGTVAGGIAAFFCFWTTGFPWRALFATDAGLGRQVRSAWVVLLAIYLLNSILIIGIDLLLEWLFGAQTTTPDFGLGSDPVANLLMLLAVVVVGPFFEELFFRGALLGVLSRYGQRYALVASAVLFGLFHGNLPQGIGATAVGLVFGWIALRTGSIVPGIFAHMLYNGYSMFIATGGMLPNPFLAGLFGMLYLVVGATALIYTSLLLTRIRPSLPAPTEEQRPLGWPRFWRCVPIWITLLLCCGLLIFSIQ